MTVRLGRIEMPRRVTKEDSTAKPTYAKFVAEPFEAGYGHTLGNSLRRVLLTSLEGAAITSVQIDGVHHEFATIPGVVEDCTEIILNLKKVLFRAHTRDPQKVSISVNREGPITAKDIQVDPALEILNPDQYICTLDKKMKFHAVMDVSIGSGWRSGDDNKRVGQPIGVLPIDALFSPIRRVKYSVENTRVGQRTDYDKLILEVWTDGRVSPDEALLHSSAILHHHLDVFVEFGKDDVEFEETSSPADAERQKLKRLLNMSVNEIELSVRAANCLNNANITSIWQLASKSEAEMLKHRNFGKKSLEEIKEKLQQLGLSLGMSFDPELIDPVREEAKKE